MGMDMNMDMSMPMASANPSSAPSSSMPGMTSTFSTSTRVTLWFTDWTTTTAAAYAFTLIFLFVLGMFNRFLAALKTQLERRWEEGATERYLRHRDGGSVGANEELEPLSPMPGAVRHVIGDEKGGKEGRVKGFWRPNAAWSAKRDGIRALFEFTRAVIGYILMLAVMTYNVGFFFAVTSSVLLGEMVFGRYTRSTQSGWQEGGCHE